MERVLWVEVFSKWRRLSKCSWGEREGREVRRRRMGRVGKIL